MERLQFGMDHMWSVDTRPMEFRSCEPKANQGWKAVEKTGPCKRWKEGVKQFV